MARKLCNICNIRPVDKAAGIDDACVPCYEEGGWENAHSDNAHEALSAVAEDAKTAGAVELRKIAPKAGIKSAAKYKSAELRAMILEAVEREQTGCWICHPELNEAQKTPRAPRKRAASVVGISRKGQKINVPLRAPGELKAQVVIRAAGEERAALTMLGGGVCVLDVSIDGTTTLHLAWDADGRYDYPRAYVAQNGKRKSVRNVAEALRLIKS